MVSLLKLVGHGQHRDNQKVPVDNGGPLGQPPSP
jgi:hypothetical protein